MSIVQLRDKLHGSIDKIENEEVLREMNIIASEALNSSNEDLIPITEAERRAIEDGLKDIEKGRVITFEEFKMKYPQWFSR
jgi:predicted transcriptional regulator